MPSDATWFRDAKFGLFIHYGLYSVPAGEWRGKPMGRNRYAEWIRMQWNWPAPGGIPRADYDALIPQFNPAAFDADAIVREAANAGMRYVVFVTKHHDGFALWHSQASRYGIDATPSHRDLVAEISAACRARGLKVGFYYSHWLDWEHPGGGLPPWPEIRADPPVTQPSDDMYERYWTEKCLPQVRELIDGFSPDLLWFDSWGNTRGRQLTPDRLGRLVSLIRTRSPRTLINSRIGPVDDVDFLSMDDNQFPPKMIPRPWETSGTTNRSWAYNKFDFDYKPTKLLLRSPGRQREPKREFPAEHRPPRRRQHPRRRGPPPARNRRLDEREPRRGLRHPPRRRPRARLGPDRPQRAAALPVRLRCPR